MTAPSVVADALRIYAGPGGAAAAAKHAGVTTRTVQRWARRRGLRSGYRPPGKVHGSGPMSYTGCTCELCSATRSRLAARARERRAACG